MYVNNYCASLVHCNKEANEIYLAYSVDKKNSTFLSELFVMDSVALIKMLTFQALRVTFINIIFH